LVWSFFVFNFLNIKLLHKILLCFLIFGLSACDDMEKKNKAALHPVTEVEKVVHFMEIPIEVTTASSSSIPLSYNDYQHFAVIKTTAEEKDKLYKLMDEGGAVHFKKEGTLGIFVPPWFDLKMLPEGYKKKPRVDSVGFDVYTVSGNFVSSTEIFRGFDSYVVQLKEPNTLLILNYTY